jgi:hypothetical protein
VITGLKILEGNSFLLAYFLNSFTDVFVEFLLADHSLRFRKAMNVKFGFLGLFI